MNTLESLRPQPQPLDPAWSATTLESILAEPVAHVPASRSRRRLAISAAVAAGLVGIGGVAYASGLVPDSVRAAFDDLDRHSGEDFDVSGIASIADFTLPDGTRYTVWRGTNASGGSCEAIREDRPGDEHDDFGVGCYFGDSADRYDQLKFGWAQLPERAGEPQNPMHYLAYGEATDAEARSVRIVGDGTAVTLPIDPVTGGFGGNLPGYVATEGTLPDLTFTFRDAAGRVLETQSPWQ